MHVAVVPIFLASLASGSAEVAVFVLLAAEAAACVSGRNDQCAIGFCAIGRREVLAFVIDSGLGPFSFPIGPLLIGPFLFGNRDNTTARMRIAFAPTAGGGLVEDLVGLVAGFKGVILFAVMAKVDGRHLSRRRAGAVVAVEE